MDVTILLLLLGLAVRGARGGSVNTARIVGGANAQISEFPYQLSLEVNGKHSCGASIIGAAWVLTAAHCAHSVKVATMTLRAGSDTQGNGGSVHKVTMKVVHSRYNMSTFDYDIALLRVSKKFQFGPGIAKIALPSAKDIIAVGATANISGWGALTEQATSIPTQLQAVSIPVLNTTVCQTAYGADVITERMICAGYAAGGKDACQGDSGGPMVSDGKQVGVVSWGHGCARPNYPGLYTSVAALRHWIKARTGI